MAKFLFNLPDDQLTFLRNLSDTTGIPIAEYIRRGVEHVVNGQVPCGLVTSGNIYSGAIVILR